ncbi:DUF1045 domain-containing protein [Roseobacter sp. OBYS 0001]|uniref:DUF1045 domain-containing protein n=1 Tax=Roseobacter sp. OBYS 0001 TaxID=882651 RepID=UPI001BBF6C59|nr:DUF1045 domain-containing protein [Roseobacter sp. OBYS 0001]GIT88554.1 phosphonate metabolism protein [Roseobacter sp. OBYS 0001]
MTYTRYAIYYTPPPGRFAELGARWLGWDIAKGQPVGSPDLDIVATPRKYGFHATLKAPFFLADGVTENHLLCAFRDLGQNLAPVALEGLEVRRLGGFVALEPFGNKDALQSLAANCVTRLDLFRAPMSEAERLRKTKPHMTQAHRQNLEQWGYAHVMDSFRFHMTLSGPLPKHIRDRVMTQAEAHFAPAQIAPLTIATITLVGERADGTFKSIEQARLRDPQTGAAI